LVSFNKLEHLNVSVYLRTPIYLWSENENILLWYKHQTQKGMTK